MNFTQIQAEVRTRLNEVSANFWADTDIKRAINDGYAEISDATEWYEVTTTVALSANTTYYVPTSKTSTEFLSPLMCQNSTTKEWLQMVDVNFLDAQVHPAWEQISSEPRYMLMRSPDCIGFTPKPTATENMSLNHTAIPADLSAGSDTPGFDQEFHFGLVEYALYDLMVQEGEIELAMNHWQQYLEFEKKLGDATMGRTSRPRLLRLQ